MPSPGYGLVVAAGTGTRFGGRKQFWLLRGKPAVYYSLRAFERCSQVRAVALATNPDMVGRMKTLVRRWHFRKVRWVVAGGELRQESVFQGLQVLPEKGVVAIHDAARPFLKPEQLSQGFRAVRDGRRKTRERKRRSEIRSALQVPAGTSPKSGIEGRACIFGLPVFDTVKLAAAPPRGSHGHGPCRRTVVRTIPREQVFRAQTPQFFALPLIRRAHAAARRDGFVASDDAQLVERMGATVTVLEGWPGNVKLTTRADLKLVGCPG